MKTSNAVAVLAVGLSFVSLPNASAQSALIPSRPRTLATVGGGENWGISSDSVKTVLAHDFALSIAGGGIEGATDLDTFGRTCDSGSCVWITGLDLPSGAQIRGVEFSACDSSSTGYVGFVLFSAPKIPSFFASLSGADTGTSATPGCSTFGATLPTPHTVDNAANGYGIAVFGEPGQGGALQFTQMRVFYRLQVSPSPAVATFPNDVPTSHPFFRFVEAMAASGLTGGCAAGSFCPDAPVTRGQLAVFLASALGLHFPN